MAAEPDYGSGERAVPIQSPSDVKYIRITDFDDDGIVPGNVFTTTENVEDRYRLDDGDVLFARSGATAGKTFLFSSDLGPSIFAGYCIRFRFDRKKVLPEFIYLYTKTNRYQAWVRSIQRPSGQPNINKAEFKSFTIPVPLSDVQDTLVSEMEGAREARRRKLAESDALLASLDPFVLERLGLSPTGALFARSYAATLKDCWARCDPDYHSPRFKELRRAIEASGYPVYELGRLAPNPRTGFAAGREAQSLSEQEGIPHVRPLNITRHGELTFEGTKLVPRDSVDTNDILRMNEVLLNNTNSTEWVGKTTVFEGQRQCCCSNHITRMTPERSLVVPWFLAALLNAMRWSGYMGLLATNFVNQAGINTETLSALRLPIPSIDEQETIAAELTRRRSVARQLREEAGREWEAAKVRFEVRLLGGAGAE
ncbi:MAG: restriction endonuclease subunit S [Acidobacteriia bacterium]|nr:restriction endonuclease subunit S [Terriglobia bacterium]